MRWDYTEPEAKVALIEGRATRLYLEEDRQLWQGTLDEAGSLLPSLLLERVPVAEVFAAELSATPARGGGGTVRLQLVPREGGEDFRQVVLRLRPPEFAIVGADVVDGAGNRMVYEFSGLRRNRGLDPSAFHFEPPPGTEIVDGP
jgi:outer membrane lipoprotein carrier protein